MIVVNASAWKTQHSPEAAVYFCGGLPRLPRSIHDALNPGTYRDQFGPFACVTYDRTRQEAALARDHLGIQPLYYCIDANRLIFAENLPDVLHHLERPREKDDAEIESMAAPFQRYRDQTLYRGIFRVEPGHLIHVAPNLDVRKSAFWMLDKHSPPLDYATDDEYLEHFSSLIREAVRVACRGHQHIAAEFSGGIDSSAVIATAHAQGIRPDLFMHAPIPGSAHDETHDRRYEHAFLDRLGTGHDSVHRISVLTDADFDPLATLDSQARLFAGPAPYLFTMFAQPLMEAVSRRGCSVLLSGFGGDQGVSGSVPDSVFPLSGVKRVLRFMKRQARGLAGPARSSVPFDRSSLLNLEWDLLQGPNSHEIRMRIEYSSLVSKALGFEYRYPLLHPPLLEFCLRVPIGQKRRGAVGRLLTRRYLATALGTPIFDTMHKREGLAILPATLARFEARVAAGDFVKQLGPVPGSLLTAVQRYMLDRSV